MTDYKYNDHILRIADCENNPAVWVYLSNCPFAPEEFCIIFDVNLHAPYRIRKKDIKLKPKTRIINGIEVPAPIPADFDFKEGEKYFHICPFSPTKIGSIAYKELNHRFASANEMLYHSAQDAKENLQAIESTAQDEK